MVTQRNITVATIHTTSVVVSIIQTYSSCTLYFHYYLSARPRVLFTHSLTNVYTGLSERKVAKLRECSAWLRSVYYILQMCRSVYTVEAVLEHISWSSSRHYSEFAARRSDPVLGNDMADMINGWKGERMQSVGQWRHSFPSKYSGGRNV